LQLGSPEFASIQAVLQDATLKRDMMAASHPRAGRLGAPKQNSYAALLQSGSGDLKKFAVHNPRSLLPIDIAQNLLARLADKIPAAGSFMQGAKGGPSYDSQSGGIFGILSGMQEQFEADLSQSQKDEATAVDDFKQLSSTKNDQIAFGKRKLDELQEGHADNQMALANAEADLKLANEKQSATAAFLEKLSESCKDSEEQFNERSSTRTDEVKAIGDALRVLTDDDNREQLAGNKKLALLQEQSVAGVATEVARANALTALSKDLHLPRFDMAALEDAFADDVQPKARLATLAVSVKIDGFDTIKANMDRMISELQSEQKEEVKFKAYCTAEFNTNEKAINKKQDEADDYDANANKVSRRLKDTRSEIATAKASIASAQASIKQAGEARATDKLAFQETVADQQATQAILKKALQKLSGFYGAKASSLIDVSDSDSKYTKSKGSSPVMMLLSHIIESSSKLEKEAMAGDAAGQKDYESFVKQSNGVIDELSTEVSTKSQVAAESQGEMGEMRTDQQNANNQVASLRAYTGDLHTKCDFVVKNFKQRQEGRTNTIEEIQHTKALLSGMQ